MSSGVRPAAVLGASPNGSPPHTERGPLHFVSIEEFTTVKEEGARALLGGEGAALIAEDTEAMAYGDGGVGKTTLLFDAAFHLSAGDRWLGISVPRKLRVAIIENEGPRAMLRDKLKRKLAAWKESGGSEIEGRVQILEEPWATFSFGDVAMRAELAATIRRNEIDVLIIGPVACAGMIGNGTIEEVREYTALVAQLRRECGRKLTVMHVHHEARSGTVSGAWEGAVDTLLRVEERGHGRTHLYIQKARWSPPHHRTHMDLKWTDGEGFEVEEERDVPTLIERLLLGDRERWLTAKEIAAPLTSTPPGVGANVDAVKKILADDERFTSRTGDDAKAVGRHSSAIVWQVTRAPESPESPPASGVSTGSR
jgi:hypothetical protein